MLVITVLRMYIRLVQVSVFYRHVKMLISSWPKRKEHNESSVSLLPRKGTVITLQQLLSIKRWKLEKMLNIIDAYFSEFTNKFQHSNSWKQHKRIKLDLQ